MGALRTEAWQELDSKPRVGKPTSRGPTQPASDLRARIDSKPLNALKT
jgi:hypothetical protein